MGKRLVAFDMESFLMNTSYPAPHGYQGPCPKVVCMSHMDSKRKHADVIKDWYLMEQLINGWLDDNNVILVNQTIDYDLSLAIEHLNISVEKIFAKYNKGLVRDVQIRENLIALATGEAVRNPGKKYSLAAHVENYFGEDISATKGEDAWRMRYAELFDVELEDWPEEAIEYPKDDVRNVMRVFAKQHKQRELFQSNELAQTRAAFDLRLISLNSPRVDPSAVKALEEQHRDQVDTARQPLIDAGVMKWNKSKTTKFPKGDPRREGWSMDTKKLGKLVEHDYNRRGLEVPLTETGKVSLKAETLLRCKHSVLKQYGEAANDIKMIDGFLPGLQIACEIPTRRVTPRYTTILKTGRTSCSKPNLQQLPKAPGGRECFLPEEGHVFVSIDFSSMEMYCLAQTASLLYGTTKLLDTLNSGQDPHLKVVEDISGMSMEDLLAGKKSGDTNVKKYRALGKIMNFGFGGGMMGATATSNLEDYEYTTVQELFPGEQVVPVMDRLSRQWKQKWELVPMFEKASKLTRGGNRPTYTCPITGRIKALNSYCQYCNMHFQPIGADALKEALRRVTEECYTEGMLLNDFGCKIAIEIHDELLMSGPEDSLAQWVPRVQRLMEEGAMQLLPDCKIQTEAGVCGEVWRKKDIDLNDYLAGERHDV